MLLWVATLASAWAGDVLMVSARSDVADAVARVAAAEHVPATDVSVLSITANLPAQDWVLVGSGRADVCATTPATLAELRAAIESAETHIAYLQRDEAVTKLDAASQRVPCLNEPLDANLAARLYYLRGVVAHGAGDSPSAEAAFRQAFAFQPSLKWDPNFPPDAVPLFESSSITGKPSPLSLVPAPPAMWIDGHMATGSVDIAPGVHIVQFGEPLITIRVVADAGSPLAIVRPKLVPANAASWASEPARREALSAVMAAAFGSGKTVYVDDGSTIWRAVTGPSEWSALAAPAAVSVLTDSPEPVNLPLNSTGSATTTLPTGTNLTVNVESGETRRRRSKFGTALMTVGGLATAGSAGFAAYTYVNALGYRTEAQIADDDNDWQRWQDAEAGYETQRGRLGYARIGLAAGAGVLAAGVVSWLVIPAPTFVQGAPGLSLSGTW